jgi:predicted aldo/keto reductase-like oxidoreductase
MLAACKAKNMGVTLMKMNPALTTSDERQMIARMKERYANDKREIPESQQKLFKITEERGAAIDEFLKKHGLAGPEQVRAAAIGYCLSRPEVHAVCPSINSFEELDAYLALSGGRFEARDATMLVECRAVYGGLTCRIGCGACQPACPRGVPVATVMRYKYYFRTLRQEKMAMEEYAALGHHGAAQCAGCDAPCEKACPHGLPVGGLMTLAHETLTLG